MKVYHFYKKLNATEAGKMHMNETYILIPRNINLEEWFSAYGKEQLYMDAKSSKEYSLILRKLSRENRITGLGPFYRDNNVRPGDKLVLEKRIDSNGDESHFVTILNSDALFVLQLSRSNGFRILKGETPGKLSKENNEYNIYYNGKNSDIKFNYLGNAPLRGDNKDSSYDFFDILINNKSIRGDFNHNNIIELFIEGSECRIINDPIYQKQIIYY